MTVRVDIGVACSPHQTSDWWVPLVGNLLHEERNGIKIGSVLAMGSALPDHNKNSTVSAGIAPPTEKRRNDLTDANRVKIVERFLEGEADYLFFLDDDTVHPPGTLSQLLTHGRDFIGGIYYNPRSPYNPIAYIKGDTGLYAPIWDFPFGAVMQVDSIGMGCTLIHRSVFEKIREEHVVYQRDNGSLVAVHRSCIRDKKEPKPDAPVRFVTGGYLRVKVTPVDPDTTDDNRAYPFFALEYGRTEDHHFCELAEDVGVKPWVDTSINCKHIKHRSADREDYKKEFLNESISQGRLGASQTDIP